MEKPQIEEYDILETYMRSLESYIDWVETECQNLEQENADLRTVLKFLKRDIKKALKNGGVD